MTKPDPTKPDPTKPDPKQPDTPPEAAGAPQTAERFDPDAGPRGDRPYPETGRPGGAQDDLETDEQ